MLKSLGRIKAILKGRREGLAARFGAQGGFSLIELIVVISILAVLTGILVPNFLKMADENKKKACMHNREAVLDIYARCVFDSSIETIQLNDAGAHKATGIALASGGATEPPDPIVYNEMNRYMACPKYTSGKPNWQISVDMATSTAYIHCDDCDTIASLDMMGWERGELPTGVDNPYTEPTESESEPPSEEETVLVKFSLNGHGSPKPDDQEVVVGQHAVEPEAPKAATYNFVGWYTEAGCLNKWVFSKPVTESMTLYAKWEGIQQSNVWPYSDDPTWWDPDKFNHDGEVVDKNLSGTLNNRYIVILTPSGIFTSKSGAQFVFVRQNADGYIRIKYEQANSPEYYSQFGEVKDALIQLTGDKTTIDLSGLKDTDSFTEPIVQNGDLVEFIYGDTSYLYVYWAGRDNNQNTKHVSDVKNGYVFNLAPYGKFGNYYAVNKAPTAYSE
ncbi:MAG: InlB B-repeat-containing protein [Lachnospiraceae bacterium]|nr:InlB B-repeat-containing protein [Candidatus Colinaster scatohippi]